MTKFKKRVTLLTAALMAGAIFGTPAMADEMTWTELKNCIDDPAQRVIIDISNNITRNVGESGDITISKERLLNSASGYYLSGADTYGGLVIGTDGNLTLTNITMQNFKKTGNNGGAIENNGTITSITGNFEHNSAATNGGAIWNSGTIGTATGGIEGKFENNTAAQKGGAISNTGTITSITGVDDGTGNIVAFKGNKVTSDSANTIMGGAIYNATNGSILNIEGNFISNEANSTASSDPSASGGAIYNEGTISNINGDFILNTATTNGGAINNNGTAAKITNITGNFSHNSANGGGAIYNFGSGGSSGEISNIAGDFESNSATTNGGAICNFGGLAKIGNIAGNFKGNHTDTNGGAIYNGGTIGNSDGTGGITGDFENNSATNSGGAIINGKTINKVTGNFTKNSAKNGGAVHNSSTINFVAENGKNITFSGNYVTDESGKGGAIFNSNLGTGGTVGLYAVNAGDKIEFTGTTPTDIPDGVTPKDIDGIYNLSILNINGFKDESGAITKYDGTVNLYNVSDATEAKGTTNIYGGTVNVAKEFIQKELNNQATFNFNGTSGEVTTLSGENGITNINSGSFVVAGNAVQKAINVNTDANMALAGDVTVSSGIKNDGNLVFGNLDTVSYDGKANIAAITGNGKTQIAPGTGEVYVSGDFTQDKVVNEGKLTFGDRISGNYSGTVRINSMECVPDSTTTFYGGNLDMINEQVNDLMFGNLNLAKDTNLMIDVDLAKVKDQAPIYDTIVADKVSGSGNFVIKGINVMSDLPQDVDWVDGALTFGDLAKHINLAVNEVGKGVDNPYQITAYSKIYKYKVNYYVDKNGGTDIGHLKFDRGSGNDGFNPAIMAAPVAAQMGGYLNLLNSYEDAFATMDMTMSMTLAERTAMKMRNKYAAADEANLTTFSPNQIPEENAGVWFRPYASFEKVNLNNGPKVGNNSYGALLGADSKLLELKHGWDVIYTGYAGYNGSHQHYEGNSIWNNGGQLGGTAVFYKNNFFTGLTATVGASVGEASTMFGREDFTMLMAGVANKTGYNWELFNGKFIIQPSWLMSYSFVNTFDYNNAAGVRIESDPLHSIQLVPGLKFIGNLPRGWQPYIGVQMVWNIMDKSRYYANNVSLPETSIDPYVQYGVGVQKRWGEKLTGFFQAMLRNGGRTGIAFSGGFRWALGKKGEKMGATKGVQKSTERNINLSVK